MPRNIIIAVVVIALGGAAYFVLGSGDKAEMPEAAAPSTIRSIPSVGMPGQAEPMANSMPADPAAAGSSK